MGYISIHSDSIIQEAFDSKPFFSSKLVKLGNSCQLRIEKIEEKVCKVVLARVFQVFFHPIMAKRRLFQFSSRKGGGKALVRIIAMMLEIYLQNLNNQLSSIYRFRGKSNLTRKRLTRMNGWMHCTAQ